MEIRPMTDALALVPAPVDLIALNGPQLVARVARVREVMRDLMEENVHYGRVPGTQKPSLWKPGAELLLMTFRIGPQVHVTELSTDDERRYRVKVTGIAQGTGETLGEGVGEASTDEEKYRWRGAVHEKEWTATPVDRRRIKYQRDGRELRQVRTWPADLGHTVLLMATKRAMLNMTRVVTACSDIFDQDLEDLPEDLRAARHPFTAAATSIADQYAPPPVSTLPPEAGSDDAPEVHHIPSERLAALPPGVVMITHYTATPTKNPNVVRTTLTVSGGPAWPADQRQITTINEGLAARAVAAWHAEQPIAITVRKGKFGGYELATLEAGPGDRTRTASPPPDGDPAITHGDPESPFG
jgi:hypothetical protein